MSDAPGSTPGHEARAADDPGVSTATRRRPASAGRRSGRSEPARGAADPSGVPRLPLPRVAATERGRRARDRILSAATELFARRGYDRTRVDDVLRASNTGKSQFYHYFDSKADLGRAVLRRQRKRSIPTNPSFGRLDNWDRLAAWFDDIFAVTERALRGDADPPPTLPIEPTNSEDPLHNEAVRTSTLRRRLLSRGLRRMKRAGLLQDESNPERLANFAAAAIAGGVRLSLIAGSSAPLRDVLTETLARLRSHAAPM